MSRVRLQVPLYGDHPLFSARSLNPARADLFIATQFGPENIPSPPPCLATASEQRRVEERVRERRPFKTKQPYLPNDNQTDCLAPSDHPRNPRLNPLYPFWPIRLGVRGYFSRPFAVDQFGKN